MEKTINILIANPAGNKTIFVLDSFNKTEYMDVANKLLAIQGINAEQVGFIIPPKGLELGRMEMCGQEFCGNASRSYALYLAKLQGIKGVASVHINVSGSDKSLEVEVNTLTNFTKISMPIPSNIIPFPTKFCEDSHLVIFDGILHIIAFNIPATIEYFNEYIQCIRKEYNVPAIGVMFYDQARNFLTPVVWVRDIDSIYFEGSCGSGSVATAAILANNFNDETHTFLLPQPKGSLEINITKENGLIKNAFLQGNIEIGVPIKICL